MTTTPAWQLRALGRLQATQGARVIDHFPTRKTGALLVYLALAPEEPRSREVLIDTFWPDADPEAGRNSLSQALCGLRRMLEGPMAPGTVLVADRFHLGLVAGSIATDAAELRAAWRACQRLDPGSADYRATLERAAGLYRGELLPGMDAEWINSEREALARVHLDVLAALVQRLLRDGHAEHAVALAHRAVAVDPLREPAHRDLIRALAADGRRAEALRHYQMLEQLLDEELGLGPDEESQALAGQLRARSAATAGSGGHGTAATPVTPLERRTAADLAGKEVVVLALRLRRDHADPEATAAYLRALGRRLRALDGLVLRPGAEQTLVAFDHEADAIAAALVAMGLARQFGGLSLSAGLHAGTLAVDAGQEALPLGPVAHRLARAAGAGQVLLSEEASLRAGPTLEADDWLEDLGHCILEYDHPAERVFQLRHGAAPAAEGAGGLTVPARRGRLPVRLSRFFGREQDRGDLLALLARPDTRLITVTGMGGTGKTRLALEVANAWEGHTRTAVHWVDLSTVVDTRGLSLAVAGTLGLAAPDVGAAVDVIRSALGTTETLLVLDNMEQLLPAGSPWVARLLAACPSLTCLVTSRLRLGIDGEQEVALRPLPLPDVADWLAGLERVPSVQLFVDRTRAGDPTFRLTPANAGDVARLCVALEGLPLAIELAAARVGVLSPAQMLERLNSRLAWLAGKRADLSERQRSLRGTIDWSHDLLDAPTRADFAAVSVFAGTWDIAAAEAVLDDPLALERMAELRDASLVMADATDHGMRFGMLEVVRLYASEHLEAERELTLRARHARHYAERAEAAAAQLTGSDQRLWLERLARDHENFMAALAWCVEEPGQVATGLRLATSLDYYWVIRGHLRAGFDATGRLLAVPETAADPRLEARARRVAGGLATLLGEVDEAQRHLQRALALQQADDDQLGAAVTSYRLALLAHQRGDNETARVLATENVARCLSLPGEKSLRTLAAVLNLLGVLDVVAGDLAGARSSLGESLAVMRRLGDRQGIANVLDNLAEIELRAGDHPAAAAYAKEVAQLAEEVGSQWMALKAVGHLATVLARQGASERAVRLLGAADAVGSGLEADLAASVRETAAQLAPGLRAQLGDRAFDEAWQAGAASSWQDLLSEFQSTP